MKEFSHRYVYYKSVQIYFHFKIKATQLGKKYLADLNQIPL